MTNKASLVLLFAGLWLAADAQQPDSSFYYRPYVQAEVGFDHDNWFPRVEADEYIKLVPEDPQLKRSFKGEQIGIFLPLPGPAIMAFSYFQPLRVNSRFSLAAGLLHRELFMATNAFYGDTSRIVDVFENGQGQQLALHRQYTEIYQFAVSGLQLSLPVGIRLSSDRINRLWFEGGLDLAPGLIYAIRYDSRYSTSEQEVLAPVGEEPRFSPFLSFDSDSLNEIVVRKALPGAGFAFYAGMPLSTGIRLSKSSNFLGRLQLMLSFQPMYVYRNSKYSTTVSRFSYRLSTGLRCRL